MKLQMTPMQKIGYYFPHWVVAHAPRWFLRAFGWRKG